MDNRETITSGDIKIVAEDEINNYISREENGELYQL